MVNGHRAMWDGKALTPSRCDEKPDEKGAAARFPNLTGLASCDERNQSCNKVYRGEGTICFYVSLCSSM